MATVYANAHVEAAVIASDTAEFRNLAERVLDSVKRAAAKNRDTGHYIDNLGIVVLKTRRGVRDRLVVADDENAQLIEFGGVVKKTNRLIPGLHIMRRGLNAVK